MVSDGVDHVLCPATFLERHAIDYGLFECRNCGASVKDIASVGHGGYRLVYDAFERRFRSTAFGSIVSHNQHEGTHKWQEQQPSK